jgi:hypothetical protein
MPAAVQGEGRESFADGRPLRRDDDSAVATLPLSVTLVLLIDV